MVFVIIIGDWLIDHKMKIKFSLGRIYSEKMKYLEENKVNYKKPRKNGNSFYICKRDRESISSSIDQKPVINSPNNYVSNPQDL